MTTQIYFVCFIVALAGHVASKSLVKMPLRTDEDGNKRPVITAQPLPVRTEEQPNTDTMIVDNRERGQNVQVTVRMLPKQTSSRENDRDLLPAAPMAKPIQMTLIARQQLPRATSAASLAPATLNHQQPPRQNTRTPPRHSPTSREMVSELIGVDIDEYSDDPFQRRASTPATPIH